MIILNILLLAQVIFAVVTKSASSAMLDFLIFCTCCVVGDVLLWRSKGKEQTFDKLFLAGIVCYAVGHISLFGMLFVQVGLNVLMLVFPVIVCAALYFVSKSHTFEFEKLFTFVWAYGLLIAANAAQCVWIAVDMYEFLPAIGISLIAFSTIMRMFIYFHERPWKHLQNIQLFVYYIGMEVLVISMTQML